MLLAGLEVNVQVTTILMSHLQFINIKSFDTDACKT